MTAKSKFRLIAINLIVLCPMLIAAGAITAGIYGIKKNQKGQSDSYNITTWHFELHPGVGHAHIPRDFQNSPNAKNSVSTSALYTEKLYNHTQAAAPITYLTLGGSTTDPLGAKFSGVLGTWPDQLSLRLKQGKKPFRIINAGAGASTSSQELLRMITVLYAKKIDLAISLNGINEIYFAKKEDYRTSDDNLGSSMVLAGITHGRLKAGGRDFYDSFYNLISDKLGLPSSGNPLDVFKAKVTTKRKIGYISEQKRIRLVKASEIWEKNVRMMRATAHEMGAEYLVFLQPTYGLDLRHGELVKATDSGDSVAKQTTHRYLSEINYLYGMLRQKCQTLSYCIDLSGQRSLTLNPALYKDPRHLNASGNLILADLIYQSLKKKYTAKI